jgi:hypothetical protein
MYYPNCKKEKKKFLLALPIGEILLLNILHPSLPSPKQHYKIVSKMAFLLNGTF